MGRDDVQIDLEFHELIAPLTSDEAAGLESSLQEEGCRDALICWNGLILDGHNRYEICTRLEIPFQTRNIERSDRDHAKEWIIKNQLARRNISLFARGRLVLKREGILKDRAKGKQRQGGGDRKSEAFQESKSGIQLAGEPILDNRTDHRLAEQAGTSHDTIHKIRVIENEGSQEIKDKLMRGEITIKAAYRETRPRAKKQKSKLPQSERADSIRSLSERGYKADQIADELAIGVKQVRLIANKAGIVLPDKVIGKRRPLDVNRIVAETVMAAKRLTIGLELINSRMENLETSHIDEWISQLRNSVCVLNRLIKQLKRRKEG